MQQGRRTAGRVPPKMPISLSREKQQRMRRKGEKAKGGGERGNSACCRERETEFKFHPNNL